MAQTKYTYSITADTLNGVYDGKLALEIQSSSILIALDYTASGEVGETSDVLNIYFKDSLSVGDETTLDNLIAAHDGVALLKDKAIKAIVESQQPFASKTLPDGKKLFGREHGVTPVTIAAGATGSLVFEIPYAAAKITGAHILGTKVGDTVNFKILDTDTGLLTTIPLYPLNQFGFSVNMPDGEYKKSYTYDADLFLGLHISVEYTNNGTETITVSMNLDIHEVV
jgi:hypothetical protein